MNMQYLVERAFLAFDKLRASYKTAFGHNECCLVIFDREGGFTGREDDTNVGT